ncbi:protein Nsg2p [Diutina catenulata]
MATLRKKALKSSGGVSPTPEMQKTDSVVNLTKPSLYGIYNDDSLLSLNDQIEISVPPSRNSKLMHPEEEVPEEASIKQLPLFTKVVILALSSYVYDEVTRHIHASHFGDKSIAKTLDLANFFILSLLSKTKVSTYVDVSPEFAIIDQVVSSVIQGLVFGLLLVVVDKITPKVFSSRLLSSNPNPDRKFNAINEVVRSSICFLGISYAIRKLEWNSFFQIASVWSLLNPALWLLLDGTANGFLVSVAVAALGCASIYVDNKVLVASFLETNPADNVSLWLWIGSFFFCASIIFGKIGRGLFQ